MDMQILFGTVTCVVFAIALTTLIMIFVSNHKIKEVKEELDESDEKVLAIKTASELALVDARKAMRINILLNANYHVKLDPEGKVYLLLPGEYGQKAKLFTSIDDAWSNFSSENTINAPIEFTGDIYIPPQQIPQSTQQVHVTTPHHAPYVPHSTQQIHVTTPHHAPYASQPYGHHTQTIPHVQTRVIKRKPWQNSGSGYNSGGQY